MNEALCVYTRERGTASLALPPTPARALPPASLCVSVPSIKCNVRIPAVCPHVSLCERVDALHATDRVCVHYAPPSRPAIFSSSRVTRLFHARSFPNKSAAWDSPLQLRFTWRANFALPLRLPTSFLLYKRRPFIDDTRTDRGILISQKILNFFLKLASDMKCWYKNNIAIICSS